MVKINVLSKRVKPLRGLNLHIKYIKLCNKVYTINAKLQVIAITTKLIKSVRIFI